MKKTIYIQDFKQGDAIFSEVFAIKSYKKGATRNNKPFVDIDLTDASGSIKGKIWSDDLGNCDTVEDGDVVEINGTVEDFMGSPQLKITNLKKTEKFELSELQQTSEFNIENMWTDIQEITKRIQNPHLKKLLDNIFDKNMIEKFKKSPAAYKVHHNYAGGLLEHTWEMLKIAQSIKKHFPKINMDLVNTGIILHDIGKVSEFELTTTVTFTNQGKLLGHVYMGAEIAKHAAPQDMPQDLLDEVLHIVLSHTGKTEFGSPVVPMTAEANAVHVIDYTSSHIRIAYSQIHGGLGNDQFTQYIPQLGTELYRSPYTDEEKNQDIPF